MVGWWGVTMGIRVYQDEHLGMTSFVFLLVGVCTYISLFDLSTLISLMTYKSISIAIKTSAITMFHYEFLIVTLCTIYLY